VKIPIAQHEEFVQLVDTYNLFRVNKIDPNKPMEMTNLKQSTLALDMDKVWKAKEFVDITFLVEGQEVQCHRSVLTVRSEYFRAKIAFHESASKMQQLSLSDSSSVTPLAIPIEDISLSAFKQIVEYLFTDHVVLTADNTVELLGASAWLLLDRLAAMCQDWLIKNTEKENALSLLQGNNRINSIDVSFSCTSM
jgi:hypothetical protein